MRILILCTGNSCRSQMAEGFLRLYAPQAQVYSAGTAPASQVHPLAVKVMLERGIDLSTYTPKSVDRFLSHQFDYVVTVCDNARESCPVFVGNVVNQIHMGFEDPAAAVGSDEVVLQKFRRIRDKIGEQFKTFAKRIGS